MTGTIIITGANSSLAIPSVQYLLTKYPEYTALLTVRNDSESDVNTKRLRTVISQFPNSKTAIHQLDLSSLSGVQDFASEITKKILDGTFEKVVAVICNAYTWSILDGLQLSQDGYELTIAVNYLAHLSLVLRLLGHFAPRGRITFVASDAHFPGKNPLQKFPPAIPADLNSLVHPKPDAKGEEVGRGFQRYAISKLAIVMGMYELNKKLLQDGNLKGISALAINPGNFPDSKTMNKGVPNLWKYGMKFFISPLLPVLKHIVPGMRSVYDGAVDLIEISVGDAFDDKRGYYTMRKKDQSSPESTDEMKQQLLWARSLEWLKITESDTVLNCAL